MGHELGRALLLADAVTPDAMANALLAAVRERVSLVRALLSTDAIPLDRLEEELARNAPDAPFQRHPVPLLDLCARLPPNLCAALVALPVRNDSLTGTVDVAVADASDAHAAEEIGFYLSAPVRLVRSPLGLLESAIADVRRASSNPPASAPISVPPPSPVRRMTNTPPWGSPALSDLAGFDEHTPTFNTLGYTPSEEHATTVSERPLPLIPKSSSERSPQRPVQDSKPLAPARFPEAPRTPGDAAAVAAAIASGTIRPRWQSEADIPIPLSRRLTPGSGLVALARAAQEPDEDDEGPIVELRRAKPPSNPVPSGVGVVGMPGMVSSGVESIKHITPFEERRRTLPSAPMNQLLRDMTKVTARDPLMELVLIAIRPFARKAALFAVKKDSFVGWMCTSDFGDRAALANLVIDARQPSLLSTTAAVGTYMASMPRNETHAPLAKFIRTQQARVLGVAIKAAGRPAVILLAHDVGEPATTMTAMTEVAKVAGDTLEKILRGIQAKR